MIGAFVAIAAIVLSGCISIKSQSADQRSPGFVSLHVGICVNDYAGSVYQECKPGVIAETDTPATHIDGIGLNGSLGQFLFGFLVPNGSDAPAAFQTDSRDAAFSPNQEYTNYLTTSFPPPAGFHWVGFISTAKRFDPKNQPSDRQTSISPEFTLPLVAGGVPFTSKYKWRVVAGFRSIADPSNAGDPLGCPALTPGNGNFCVISPNVDTVLPIPATPALNKSVSDFGVVNNDAPAVGQGETAVATFPVRYSDLGALGKRDLQIAVTTTVPGSTAQAATSKISVTNGDTPVSVNVPVPATTAPGRYTATMTATDGKTVPATVRTGTATITVVDRTAPAIRIGTPGDNAVFTQGQRVVADYECTDNPNGSGLSACSGLVPSGAPIDTATVGAKTFTVNARDIAGNTSSVSRNYTVVLPSQVAATVSYLFAAGAKFTKLGKLEVKNIPAGSNLFVTCKGSSCPKTKPKKAKKGKKQKKPVTISFTKLNANGTVPLKAWTGKALKPGTVINVVVTNVNLVGVVKAVKIRSRKEPLVTTTCLAPGSSTQAVACPK
jgi:hypothetical protein